VSDLIENAQRRKDLLKHMILQLHHGEAPDQVRPQLARLLGQVPYSEVVEVEQELINEGMPTAEIQRLCDLHSASLQGLIDITRAPQVPEGHPVHTFRMENAALGWETQELDKLYGELAALADQADATEAMALVRVRFSNLMDVDKHYLRKEHLLFPFLEKKGITGPPKVMWGKHDETRALLRAAMETLRSADCFAAAEARSVGELILRPASTAVREMIDKEEHILLPMCLDTLTAEEWFEVARQSGEFGYCLYDPPDTWRPEGWVEPESPAPTRGDQLQLPSGSLSPAELTAILNTIPFDLTFVDQHDTVRYFTQGRERVFARNRAILGRQVQYCHPPASVKAVEQILTDFHTGGNDRAAFWITVRGRFIHIEYFALRDPRGEYLGCLEVSQDLTEKRALTGEQRLLSYPDQEGTDAR
jgi:DUF438 domain-containing protein